jgi:hypothetical protein
MLSNTNHAKTGGDWWVVVTSFEGPNISKMQLLWYNEKTKCWATRTTLKTGGDCCVVFGVLRDPISEKCNFYDLFEISLQK